LDKENGPGFLVLLLERDDGRGKPCDGCIGIDTPFCMQYCHKKEELQEMIKEFLEKVKPEQRNNITDSGSNSKLF
jgi:hypothetical protein